MQRWQQNLPGSSISPILKSLIPNFCLCILNVRLNLLYFLIFSNFQAVESESMMARFQNVYERISVALEGMPYEELGIPQEDIEQVR